MDKTEVQALIKESLAPLQAENKLLREQLAAVHGPGLIMEALRDIRLPEASKQRIGRALAGAIPIAESGQVDTKKLNEMVESAAKDEALYLSQLPGFGEVAAIGKRLTEAELAEQHKADGKAHDERFQESLDSLCEIFVGPKLVKGQADEAARVARKVARKAFKEGRAA